MYGDPSHSASFRCRRELFVLWHMAIRMESAGAEGLASHRSASRFTLVAEKDGGQGMDQQTTDDIYLCQVGETLSCGACCGLYNLPDPSFHAVSGILSRRTALFSDLSRDMEAILAFGEKETALIGGPPMAEFHHCPYLGLIGPEKNRVGCLLHPLGDGNHGIDYRGLSHYGSMTCQMYFCPTHRLTPFYLKVLLCNIIEDWYAFGLVVPETDLLAAMDEQIRARAPAAEIDTERALKKKTRRPWQTLLTLKRDWPYRVAGRPWANYFFNDALYGKPAVDYGKTGQTSSRYDKLFRELHSVFDGPADLARAETFMARLFDDLAGSLGA